MPESPGSPRVWQASVSSSGDREPPCCRLAPGNWQRRVAWVAVSRGDMALEECDTLRKVCRAAVLSILGWTCLKLDGSEGTGPGIPSSPRSPESMTPPCLQLGRSRTSILPGRAGQLPLSGLLPAMLPSLSRGKGVLDAKRHTSQSVSHDHRTPCPAHSLANLPRHRQSHPPENLRSPGRTTRSESFRGGRWDKNIGVGRQRVSAALGGSRTADRPPSRSAS